MEKALIVGLNREESTIRELHQLCLSIGIKPVETINVNLDKPNPAWLIGSGKTEEIIALAQDLEAEMIIFNPALSPSQQRNWEKASGLCVIDRHEVILEIFSSRAVTREAALQTGLARMEYSLPRLTRAWTHLSRQRGGTKGTRGEGETQLEIDRRIVLRKISKMKRELEEVKKQRAVQRSRRAGTLPSACLVGYTNAGKSSLLNRICDADILAEDKLFATLDPTTRTIKLKNGRRMTITDTVGFIRDLPHKLVQAFHSTLEEAVLADFLLLVIDASDPEAVNHYRTTLSTLNEIGASGKRMITVFNKTDLLENEDPELVNIKPIIIEQDTHVFCSVKNGEGLEELIDAIETMLREGRADRTFRFPADDEGYRISAFMHGFTEIISESFVDSYIEIKAVCSEEILNRYRDYLID